MCFIFYEHDAGFSVCGLNVSTSPGVLKIFAPYNYLECYVQYISAGFPENVKKVMHFLALNEFLYLHRDQVPITEATVLHSHVSAAGTDGLYYLL